MRHKKITATNIQKALGCLHEAVSVPMDSKDPESDLSIQNASSTLSTTYSMKSRGMEVN